METNNTIKVYTTDIKIITRTRGWRSKLADSIKSFPPAGLESPNRKAVIEVVITLKTITITKTWR